MIVSTRVTTGAPSAALTNGASYKSIFQMNARPASSKPSEVVLPVGIVVGREVLEGAYLLKRLAGQDRRKRSDAGGDEHPAAFEGGAERVVELLGRGTFR